VHGKILGVCANNTAPDTACDGLSLSAQVVERVWRRSLPSGGLIGGTAGAKIQQGLWRSLRQELFDRYNPVSAEKSPSLQTIASRQT